MKVQRPLVTVQGNQILYSRLTIKQGRRYLKVDGKNICMGTTEEPAFVPNFEIIKRDGVEGWAGICFFKEHTRKSGRQVFEF